VFVNGGPGATRDVECRVIDENGFEVARGEVARPVLPGERQKRTITIRHETYKRLDLIVKVV
jgi:hypothetical protein